MDLKDKVVVVTGGAGGIGRALCERFAAAETSAVVVADVDESAAEELADQVRGLAVRCDVSVESDVRSLVNRTVDAYGRIDLFCSNAGVTVKGGIETPNEQWQRLWDVNLMSRIYAARAVLPVMLEQGGGYLLQTASAAGLLTEIGSAAYTVTKQADVALAEWLWIHYKRRGIGVSCLCPMGVTTEMLDEDDPIHRFLYHTSISPEDVAEAVVAGLAEEQFLILPHPQIADLMQLKAQHHANWMKAAGRLMEKLDPPRP